MPLVLACHNGSRPHKNKGSPGRRAARLRRASAWPSSLATRHLPGGREPGAPRGLRGALRGRHADLGLQLDDQQVLQQGVGSTSRRTPLSDQRLLLGPGVHLLPRGPARCVSSTSRSSRRSRGPTCGSAWRSVSWPRRHYLLISSRRCAARCALPSRTSLLMAFHGLHVHESLSRNSRRRTSCR